MNTYQRPKFHELTSTQQRIALKGLRTIVTGGIPWSRTKPLTYRAARQGLAEALIQMMQATPGPNYRTYKAVAEYLDQLTALHYYHA